MKHTYLFEEGLWKASGIFVDEKGRKFPVEGEAAIAHYEAVWRNTGWMRVLPCKIHHTG
jgi:hypothetical protein